MRRRSPGTFFPILVLVLLLGTSTSVYADAISITSVSLSNLQIVPTSGTIVFSLPEVGPPRTSASGAAANSFGEESSNGSVSPTRSEASTSVTFAGAGGVSDFATLSLNANSNVMLSGCICSAESEGLASLRTTFTIVGGTGNVGVNFSALLQTVQNLVTDEFSLFAASDVRFNLQVLDVGSFSFDNRLHIGPNDSNVVEMQRQLSEILTLQFDQQYTLLVFVGANSRGSQNEIPEPATVLLLVSGLGFMAGFVKRRKKI
jgi:PEP-CTERM motif